MSVKLVSLTLAIISLAGAVILISYSCPIFLISYFAFGLSIWLLGALFTKSTDNIKLYIIPGWFPRLIYNLYKEIP